MEFIMKNDQRCIIREVKTSDAENMIEYLNKIGGESDNLTFGFGEIQMPVEEEVKFIEGILNSETDYMYVVEDNGELIGNISLMTKKSSRVIHTGILGITVRKEYWGQGLGKKLMQLILSKAKSNGTITKINLEVKVDNEAAIHLYKQLGFKEEGRIRRKFKIGEEYYDALLMGKII